MLETFFTQITSVLSYWTDYINTITHGNEFFAGIIGGGGLAWLGWIFRTVPRKVLDSIKHMCTTTITTNNGGWEQQEIFGYLLQWAEDNTIKWASRTKSASPSSSSRYEEGPSRVTVSIGYGNHLAFWRGRPLWINLGKLESSGSERQKEEITITMLGRSHKLFGELFHDIIPKKDDADKVAIHRLDMDGDWVQQKKIVKRSLDSVAINKDVREGLISRIDHFKENREWYHRNSLAHKLSIILAGPPGTGKTSIIRAVASHYNMNLCLLPLSSLTDRGFEKALMEVKDNSVIIVEDFDSCAAFHSREEGLNESGGYQDSTGFSPLTLSGILNVMDGVVPLDNCILFFTTNHLDIIDPAVTRKGRTDVIFEISDLDSESIEQYVKYVFPDEKFDDVTFIPGRGCNLNEALLCARDDPKEFIDTLERLGMAKRTEE